MLPPIRLPKLCSISNVSFSMNLRHLYSFHICKQFIFSGLKGNNVFIHFFNLSTKIFAFLQFFLYISLPHKLLQNKIKNLQFFLSLFAATFPPPQKKNSTDLSASRLKRIDPQTRAILRQVGELIPGISAKVSWLSLPISR
jgi:hypothetical protein